LISSLRFAFVETYSEELVEKAKAEMEGLIIQERKLRVRS
jgi:RNA recognition motif-containing protein